MSVVENKALVRRFYEEIWDKGNTEFAYEVFADDYVRHDLRPSQALPGPEGQKRVADDFRAAFPDLRVTVDLVVGEENVVVGPLDGHRHASRFMGCPGTHRPNSHLLCRQHLPVRGRQGRRDLEPPR